MWDRITKNLRKDCAISLKSTGAPGSHTVLSELDSSLEHDSASFLYQLNLALLHEKIIC